MKKNFQVNLGGIINILANHLYSNDTVFIRELLQNANDAITSAKQLEETLSPKITLEIIEDQDQTVMILEDNGVGLTHEEIEQFLSSVGSSIKRKPDSSNQSFIGQFGVGLLSCFMVCEEINLITKSRKDLSAHKWVGYETGNYSTSSISAEDFQFGTKVFIKMKDACRGKYTGQKIKTLAKEYGNFLPYPILFKQGETEEQLNDQYFPWENNILSVNEREDHILKSGEEAFDKEFIHFIELDLPEVGVKGIAYIAAKSSTHYKSNHQIYLKRMWLSKLGDDLLPDWAFFINCSINSERLSPTASRESLYKNDALFDTKNAISAAIKKYFVRLSEEDPDLLIQIIHANYQAFKNMAVTDSEFYNLIIKWIKFRTTLGEFTLYEIVENQESILYIDDADKYKQIAPIALAKDICIINAGYVYDRDLIQKFGVEHPDVTIEYTDADDLVNLLESITLEEREVLYSFIAKCDEILEEFDCKVEIKRFSPQNLPSIYIMSESNRTKRSLRNAQDKANPLWSGVLNQLMSERMEQKSSKLCLNIDNTIVQKLSLLKDQETLRNCLTALYINSLLLGHHPLNAKEMRSLTSSMTHIIELGLSNQS